MKTLAATVLLVFLGANFIIAQKPLKNRINIIYNKNNIDNNKASATSPMIQYDRSFGGKLGIWANFSGTNSANSIIGLTLIDEKRERKDFSTGLSYQFLNKGKFFANIKPGVSVLHRKDKSASLIDFLARSLSSTYTVTDFEVSNYKGVNIGLATEAEFGMNIGKRFSITSRYGFRSYSKIGNTQNFGLGLGVRF